MFTPVASLGDEALIHRAIRDALAAGLRVSVRNEDYKDILEYSDSFEAISASIHPVYVVDLMFYAVLKRPEGDVFQRVGMVMFSPGDKVSCIPYFEGDMYFFTALAPALFLAKKFSLGEG